MINSLLKIKREKSRFLTGFTIIEIIVVIAIIAILTTIVYASLSQIRAKSRDQKRVADIHEIQLALEYYFNKNGQYPEVIWPTDVAHPEKSLYGFLGSRPEAPSVGEIYNYVPIKLNEDSERCSSYHLWTTLELKSSALDSKKSFNSVGKEICGAFVTEESEIDASLVANALVYDLHP